MAGMENFLEKAEKLPEFKKIVAVILYGSSLEKNRKPNDIDLCFVFEGNKKEQINFRLKLLKIAPDRLDIQLFNLLPVYLRIEILKGKIVYLKNREKMYDIALSSIKEFVDFKKSYLDYISKEKIII